MSYSNSKFDNFLRNIILTMVMWIIIPIGAHIINQFRVATSSLNVSEKITAQQNEIADFYINILHHLQPNLETTLIDLGLILLGIILTIHGWGKLLGPIASIIGIILAIWIANYFKLYSILN